MEVESESNQRRANDVYPKHANQKGDTKDWSIFVISKIIVSISVPALPSACFMQAVNNCLQMSYCLLATSTGL